MTKLHAIVLCALALTAAPSAQAHHSRALFNTAEQVEVVGEVRRFQLANPHCYIQLMVTDARGVQREYPIEMGAPLHLQENGWTSRRLRPGDRVRIVMHPLRNGDPGGELASITSLDGRRLGRAN